MYDTPEKLRAFLALCLDPGYGRAKRTPEDLTRILPEPILNQLQTFAPSLGALRTAADRRQQQADTARLAWAAGLAEWIEAPDRAQHCTGEALTQDASVQRLAGPAESARAPWEAGA